MSQEQSAELVRFTFPNEAKRNQFIRASKDIEPDVNIEALDERSVVLPREVQDVFLHTAHEAKLRPTVRAVEAADFDDKAEGDEPARDLAAWERLISGLNRELNEH